MHYKDTVGLRYPKGTFAMATVYSLAGSSILASIIFSLLLFLSIDDNIWMKVLFGSLAIIFEVGKFFAWYEYGERRAHHNYRSAGNALIFYIVLAAISIGGSIGGINSATNQAQGHIAIAQAKVDAFNRQISAIDKQIALNDQAAEKYIELDRITYGVSRIQAENKKLREEQQKLALERDSLPPVTQGSVIGLIESLAKVFGVETKQAQLVLVVFLSFLLDFFAAFFVAIISEELRFCRFYNQQRSITIDAIPEPMDSMASPMLSFREVVEAEPTIAENNEPTIEEKVIDALRNSMVACSKKAVMRKFKLQPEEVERIFSQLLAQGIMGRKANNHYHLLSD